MAEQLSLYEHCVRRLRFMRASGESRAEQERVANQYLRNLALDPVKLLEEAAKPGPVDGHPYTAAAKAKALSMLCNNCGVNMATKQEKIALIEKLRDEYDHVFMSPKGVQQFAEPFGATVKTFVHKATPNEMKGLTLKGEGRDAAEVAEAIADHLGCKYPEMFGRGSRLRVACEAVLAKLRSE
jgi:hypothetical protein